MSYRKSKCPACGENEYKRGREDLCGNCERLIQIGKDHLEQIEKGGLTIISVDMKFAYGFYKPDEMPAKFDAYKLPSLLVELAGGRWSSTFRSYNAKEVLGTLGGGDPSNPHTYEIPSEKIDKLKEVIDAIYRIVAWEKADSVHHGQSVLQQLASGEMSPDDFNRFEKHYLVPEKPKRKSRKK